MNNKTVIFDWGGVILKEFPEKNCDRDAIHNTLNFFNPNLNKEDTYQIYLDTLKDENGQIISIFDDYESKYKWYKRINDLGNLNTTYEEYTNKFIEEYKKTDKYEDVVNFIYSLKEKCKLCLFSDLIFTCYPALATQIRLEIFDRVFLSFKEGYTKSDPNAFKNVQEKIKVEPNEILFVDNFERNINNAINYGWNTCLAGGNELDKIVKCVNDFLKI